MNKKCSNCGQFMKLTDRLPMWDEDEYDYELAAAHGISDYGLNPRYSYVQDQWECANCDVLESHTEGKRYYYNAKTNQYDLDAPQAEAKTE